MGFHHLAIATRDTKATHAFYTGPMGFSLVKVVTAKSGKEGWAKHLFYETGNGELMAFWELHDDDVPADWSPAISTGLGLPPWANHIAFAASGLDDIAAKKQRLLDHGVDVMEIDHGWCHSIYVTDPNGILVEFCTTTRAFTSADHEEAARRLADPHHEIEPTPEVLIHRATKR